MKLIPWSLDRITEIVKLWNKELHNSFPMREELLKQNSFLDENVCLDGSRIAVDERDRIIGFVVAKRWQEELQVGMRKEVGWIQVILIDHRYRNLGIGKKMLTHVETIFKDKGIERILIGRDPWHYFPGIPHELEDTKRWFERQGYEQQGKDYDLMCNYDSSSIASTPDFEEVEFSLLIIEEKDQFLDFLHRCFPGRWEYEAIHYFEKGGNGREFVLLKKEGGIIGFCRINDSHSPIIAQNVYWAPLFRDELGGIGPLGIDANERKNGYGLAIVEAGVAFLRKRGINRVVIDWTGLVDFYKKLGYDV
ncbi:GNAT family N-acetyltransferase [Ornithinibacillus sp. L9]|uniref:GNAT family N-acetyltransferase n=1 Tax=Ornithinibacillus caprae TaxID=2678566 RepID=A0A6N8FHG2_9BACI|nr:GNAT family N-acetyltransferase [Ornithinibacillus caprae]MUK89020.1 GNAT family N-acetyltransferase [Ornithinibacillus caprae]